MRDRPSNSKDRSLVVAWGLAAVFLALIAAPMLRDGDSKGRPPGVIDIGTPGASATIDGAVRVGSKSETGGFQFVDDLLTDDRAMTAEGTAEGPELAPQSEQPPAI